MTNDVARLWAAIQQVKANTARQSEIDTVVGAANDPALWANVSDTHTDPPLTCSYFKRWEC